MSELRHWPLTMITLRTALSIVDFSYSLTSSFSFIFYYYYYILISSLGLKLCAIRYVVYSFHFSALHWFK